jgi:hypothetical protein
VKCGGAIDQWQLEQLPPEHPAQPLLAGAAGAGAESPSDPEDAEPTRERTALMSLLVLAEAHLGQGGHSSRSKTSSSNSVPQSSHWYSNMGMACSGKECVQGPGVARQEVCIAEKGLAGNAASPRSWFKVMPARALSSHWVKKMRRYRTSAVGVALNVCLRYVLR